MSDLPILPPNSDEPVRDDVGDRERGRERGSSGENELAHQWIQLFEESTAGLRAFLRHRLRQESDVDDCLQVVFVRMLESIQEVAPAARKAWLFRVAANESARTWRHEATSNRVLEKQAVDSTDHGDPADQVIRNEATLQVNQLLQRLPPAWQEIVRLRIHQNLTFQEIADQLAIPLGTALTRMRRALERLKAEIDQDTK